MKNWIGIFDSGIGGLSVYKEIRKQLPNENIVYLADEVHCPYGIKTKEEIRAISIQNIEILKEMGAKVVVIACNTATSSIVDRIEQDKDTLLGVIQPTALEAKKQSNGKIGLFATNLTVKSGVYNTYFDKELSIVEGCSDLVPYIEAHDYDNQEINKIIFYHTQKMKEIDTLILGCTHFSFIKKKIQDVLPTVKIIDSGKPTCASLIDMLVKTKRLEPKNKMGKSIYITTGDERKALEQLQNLGIFFDEVYHRDV